MANVIYRGDTRLPPKTKTASIDFAGKPGQPVSLSAAGFTAPADNSQDVYILNNLDFVGMSVCDAYAIDDSAVAYEVKDAKTPFQVFAAAGALVYGDKLAVISGVYTKAVSTNVAIMKYTGAGETVPAGGGLVDADTIFPETIA